MITRATNKHHNVPSSFLGSSLSCNLSQPAIERHRQFHGAAKNYPLDFLMRRLLVAASFECNFDTPQLPIGLYRDMFALVLTDDWRDFYEPNAYVIPSLNDDLMDKHASGAIHLRRAIDQEIAQVRSHALEKPKEFKIAHELNMFADGLKAMLHAHSTTEAIYSLLTEETPSCELCWAKAVKPEIRQELLHIASVADLEAKDSNYMRLLDDIIQNVYERLHTLRAIWQPHIQPYRSYIETEQKNNRQFSQFVVDYSSRTGGRVEQECYGSCDISMAPVPALVLA